IFVLGGSTVQGRPWSIPTSFTTFLQQALSAADPERSWEVVNCGGISYASYRLVPIMTECLSYEPDLFIVCTGHNEFLEDVTYADHKETSGVVPQATEWLQHLRSFRAVRQLIHSGPTTSVDRPVLPAEVDALLDHQGGLEMFRRDDGHAQDVVRHFRSNLLRMTGLARQHHIPLLMLQPPSSLVDCPPFKSQLSVTDPALVSRVRDSVHAASEPGRTPAESIQLLQSATQVDERFAFAWYQLGHALIADRRFHEAVDAFVRARDEDICPLRMTSPLEQTMHSVVEETGTPFVNLHEFLAGHCANGLVGDQVLCDHIHPSFRSHHDMALLICEWMMDSGLVKTPPDADAWQRTCRRQFEAHLTSLDNLYFLRGQRALEDLKGWAAGRAEGPPVMKNRKQDREPPDINSEGL
ncbi:MAG: hypothetical protein KDA96_20910, partial [Planctomycetaceae bacterium]|nr:hypothetical protein [Planctomycetaceae bacterium]